MCTMRSASVRFWSERNGQENTSLLTFLLYFLCIHFIHSFFCEYVIPLFCSNWLHGFTHHLLVRHPSCSLQGVVNLQCKLISVTDSRLKAWCNPTLHLCKVFYELPSFIIKRLIDSWARNTADRTMVSHKKLSSLYCWVKSLLLFMC